MYCSVVCALGWVGVCLWGLSGWVGWVGGGGGSVVVNCCFSGGFYKSYFRSENQGENLCVSAAAHHQTTSLYTSDTTFVRLD